MASLEDKEEKSSEKTEKNLRQEAGGWRKVTDRRFRRRTFVENDLSLQRHLELKNKK